MRNKVLCIAVDGAEYSYIVNHPELKGFRQAEFGFHSVPHLSTSILFSCFIIGIEPEDLIKHRSKILNRISRRFLGKYLFKPKNIFQSIKPSLGIEIPTYTKGKECSTRILPVADMIKYGKEGLRKMISDEFYNTSSILERSSLDNLFIMVHFGILDLYQHYSKIYGINEVHKAYLLVDDYLLWIQKTFKDYIIFMVSDHGLINGIHQPYGFFSINKELGLNKHSGVVTWTDYKDIFENMIKGRKLFLDFPIKKDWKLAKTLHLIKKVESHGLCIIDDNTLEYLVLKHILDKNQIIHFKIMTKNNYLINTKRWHDGINNNYMDYQIIYHEVNPLIHWTGKDVAQYALDNNISIPKDYDADDTKILEVAE